MAFSDNFSDAFNKSAATSGAGAIEFLKEKMKKNQTNAENKLKATTINNAALTIAQQSGDPEALKNVQTILEAIGDSDPDASKIVFNNLEQRIKDRVDFDQTLQTEGFKAKMSFIPEVTKAMVESGQFSPEQAQLFAGLATEKAQAGIAGRIQQATQPQMQQQAQPTTQTATDETAKLFSEPLPPKKSDKQKDFEDVLQHGLKILDETEKQYNFISEKYGTGRIKGLATTARGKLGDLLSSEEQAPEVVPYLNNLEGLANFIGKSLYRDERVSDVNIKGYRKALAELTNTPEEAKIMFNTLRKYGKNPNDIKVEMALRAMIPKNNSKGMMPSQALKKQGLLSREEKIALLKEKRSGKSKRS